MKRTCESAGVASHWCPCVQYTNIDVKSDQAVYIAKQVLLFINKLLCQVKETCELCATLLLKDIVKSRKRTTSKAVPAFLHGSQKVMYEVTLETTPSGGLFEATVLVDLLREK